MKERYTLREASSELGTSRTAIYSLIKNHSDLVGTHLLHDERGRRTISREGIELLRPFTNGPREKQPEPVETNPEEKETRVLSSNYVDSLRDQVLFLQNQLDKLTSQTVDERKRTDTILLTLTQEMKTLRLESSELREKARSESYEKHKRAARWETAANANKPASMGNGKGNIRHQASPESLRISGFKRLILEFFYPKALRGRV